MSCSVISRAQSPASDFDESLPTHRLTQREIAASLGTMRPAATAVRHDESSRIGQPYDLRTYVLTPTGDLRRLHRVSSRRATPPTPLSLRPSYIATQNARRAEQRIKWIVIAIWVIAVAGAGGLALAAADILPLDVPPVLAD